MKSEGKGNEQNEIRRKKEISKMKSEGKRNKQNEIRRKRK